MSRGYRSNYRGRRSTGKTVLAVVLTLIILASVGFIFLQEKVLFFDETGTAYFRLPGQSVEEETAAENVDLTIEPIEEAAPPQKERRFCGFHAPVPLDRENWSLRYREAKETFGEDCGAVVVTLKDREGTVHFDSVTALPGTVRFYAEETDVALEAALSSPLHTIARISCFHDPKAANREVEAMGLENTGGFIFYDGNNSQWLDPAKRGARDYLTALACEAAALGFDEILLSDLSYPTEGKLDKIACGEGDKAETLDAFLLELHGALAPYGVALSVELPAETILRGEVEAAGHHLGKLSARVECIYAETTPEAAHRLAEAVEAAGDAAFTPILEEYSEEWATNSLLY